MPGKIIESFIVKIVRIKELLQALELVGKGHGTPHHE